MAKAETLSDIELAKRLRLVHDWQPYKAGWIHVPGKPDCFVRTKGTPQGFLWQCGTQYGFAANLELAIQWAETAREYWPRKLPK